MVKAFYPGSFDPVHNGHIAIIETAAKIFDHVVVGIGFNSEKKGFATPEERVDLLKQATVSLLNVSSIAFEGLTTEAAKNIEADCLLKGVRSATDFDSEMLQARMNLLGTNTLSTILVPAAGEDALVSSTYVRQIASLGGDVSAVVPDCVARYLAERFKNEF